ncbi:MAG: hypothetical protein KUG79_08355 [Pseudomonadales bacterium]|nr:hypothetical protein [Pseudomonadales bacterium]
MSIFSKRDKNGRFQSTHGSDKSSSVDSKPASTPSDSVSGDDSAQSSEVDCKTQDEGLIVKSINEPTKMDNARIVFSEMFGKDGIARKDIILEFQSHRVKLTKAGAGTYYAKLKREHLDNLGKKG